MTFTRSTLMAALAGTFFAAASGAQTRTNGLQCSINPDHFINCSSDADCSAAWRSHLCGVHGMTQYCGGSGAEPAADFHKMSAAKAATLGGMVGLVGGAVAGGAVETGKTDEEKAADKKAGLPPATVQYAAIGTGIGVMFGLTMSFIAKHTALPPDAWWQRTELTRTPGNSYRLRFHLRW